MDGTMGGGEGTGGERAGGDGTVVEGAGNARGAGGGAGAATTWGGGVMSSSAGASLLGLGSDTRAVPLLALALKLLRTGLGRTSMAPTTLVVAGYASCACARTRSDA